MKVKTRHEKLDIHKSVRDNLELLGYEWGDILGFKFIVSKEHITILKPRTHWYRRQICIGKLIMADTFDMIMADTFDSQKSMWTLRVFGRVNYEEANKIANELSERLGKEIRVTLETEHILYEKFGSN